MPLASLHWSVAPSADAWLAEAVARIEAAERRALAESGCFHVVLAGGSTPARVYRALASTGGGSEVASRGLPPTSQSPGRPKIDLTPSGGGSGFASRGLSTSQSPGRPKIDLAPSGGGSGFASRGLSTPSRDWSRWRLWLGDERCLPPDHADRNSVMARAALGPAAAARLEVIAAELGAEAAARDYAARLADVPAFDLVLLGLGEDGHTASLFPGNDWGAGEDAADALPVFNAAKPPSERVSLSARRLSNARAVLFLVNGAGKQDAIRRWRAIEALGVCEPGAVDFIPAAAIRPAPPAVVEILLSPDTCPPDFFAADHAAPACPPGDSR